MKSGIGGVGRRMQRPVARRVALGSGLAATLGLLLTGADRGAEPNTQQIARPRALLAHLFRRAAFGAGADELDAFEPLGYQAAVDRLLGYETVPDPIEERLAALTLDLQENRGDLKRWWMVRMVHTTRPLQEKMTLFWHGLLTSGFSKVNFLPLLQQQNEFLRANALGSFRDLLVGIARDPAMLIWLDGRNSRKKQPNENFARELMELFTMGQGHYTEQDVQEAARAFTGWTLTEEGTAYFNPKAYDGGVKTFLGQTGAFTAEDIIDIILSQRATAEYVSRRLFTFLAYPDPDPGTIAPLADTFTASGYSIRAVVRQILLSEAFTSERAYRSTVRGPVDLVVSAHRLLGIETDGLLPVYMARLMGQDLFNPPNVAGWPGGETWLNSAAWLYRMNFAHAITTRSKKLPPQALDLSGIVAGRGLSSPAQLVEYFVDLLLDGDLRPEARERVEAYLFSGDPVLTLEPRSLDRQGRALVYLLLASPEFQLM